MTVKEIEVKTIRYLFRSIKIKSRKKGQERGRKKGKKEGGKEGEERRKVKEKGREGEIFKITSNSGSTVN